MPKSIRVFFGWILLIAGILIIGWGLFTSYKIFYGKIPAPEIFTVTEEQPEPPSKKKGFILEEEAIKGLLQEQLKEVLPVGFLLQILNLLSWSIFAGILIFGGGKIATLGILLLKPIHKV
jgi:hypothetical protein